MCVLKNLKMIEALLAILFGDVTKRKRKRNYMLMGEI
jgi:hypothetical protein